jgi:hypothetical protein
MTEQRHGTEPTDVQDPTGFVLAAADLRERRATYLGVLQSTWRASTQVYDRGDEDHMVTADDVEHEFQSDVVARMIENAPTAEHIAAEANPEHALAEVALWRGIAQRHRSGRQTYGSTVVTICMACAGERFPCPDLLAAVAAARAYLTGAGG